MAKKQAEQASLWPNLEFSLENPFLQQGIAFICTLFGLLLVVSLLRVVDMQPTLWIASLLRQLFGYGAFVAAPLVVIASAWSLRALVNETFHIPWRRVVGSEVFLLALLALLQTNAGAEARNIVEPENGGGVIGWAIRHLIATAVGDTPAFALLLLVALVGAIWAFNVDLVAFSDWVAAQIQNMLDRMPDGVEADDKPAPAPKAEPVKRERKKPVTKEKSAPVETFAPAPTQTGKKMRRDKRLPSLDIFRARSKIDIDTALMDERAHIIEETLDSFGIPVKVVEKLQGPTVTQFGLKPGDVERKMPDGTIKRMKVKVSRITSLANDLALALAASPIRIEAPVPGKPVVGVEVPNEKSSMVSLRSVLEYDGYRKLEKPLKIALGQDVAGTPVYADLASMPHVLIAGATGSGKSVCINAVIASLLVNNTPSDLRFLMIDPKMVELVLYNGIPHLLHPVVTDLDKASGALQWAMREMDHRYQMFKEAGARNLETYNKRATEDDRLPYVVVVIDELADLMMTAPEEIEKTICRLAQMARATGIHLVLATQRPSVDVVTGLIKANFPARISFAVTSQTDSRVILDGSGAEKLLGRGDMLYMAPDSPKLQRLQGCYVSDDELKALVQHWRDIAIEEALAEAPIELPKMADSGANGKEKGDELLNEAIALVRQFDRASTSFLQRRMGIGYNRAAKLIDIMESEGIIGPAKEGGLAREVLLKADPSEDEITAEEEEST